MAKKVKFTFKLQEKEVGLASRSLQHCDVKLDKLVVGMIHAPSYLSKTNEYTVSFAVKHHDPEKTVDWKWIHFKTQKPTLKMMKEFINQPTFISHLTEKYQLHSFDS